MRRRSIGSSLAAAGLAFILAGCGASGATIPALPAAADHTAALQGDLLYVAHAMSSGSRYIGVVSILTFPKGKEVATIPLSGFGTGTCSDASGDVWVTVGQNGGKHDKWEMVEYAHGGTKPISTIRIERAHGLAGACAVDPATGDLAVMVGSENCGVCKAYAYIWAGARRGTPRSVVLPFTPVGCAYDTRGDLFVDGYVGSTVIFGFAELAKDAKKFANITLDKRPEWIPGGVAWDGKYVDLEDEIDRHFVLYRVSVTHRGHVVGFVDLKHLAFTASFAIEGNWVAATTGYQGKAVRLFAYPAGGKAQATLGRYPLQPRGVTISTGG